jgi:hypothetical protein
MAPKMQTPPGEGGVCGSHVPEGNTPTANQSSAQASIPNGFSDQPDAITKLRLIGEAAANKNLNASAVRLLIALVDYFTGKDGCFPSYAQMAERAAMSRDTAMTEIKSLRREGLIHVQETSGGRNQRNRYYFKCTQKTVKPTAPFSGETVAPTPLFTDETVAYTPPPSGVHATANGGVHATRSNPIFSTPSNNPKGADAHDASFERFYSAFPERAGPTKKGAAARAFREAMAYAGSAEQIIAGAKRYAWDRKGQDPKFTRAPHNWLRERGWEDEPAFVPTEELEIDSPEWLARQEEKQEHIRRSDERLKAKQFTDIEGDDY